MSRVHVRCVVLALACAFDGGFSCAADSVSCAQQSSEPDGHDDKERLNSIEQIYSRNRGLFKAFTCKFRVVEGRAENIEDALNGRLDDAVRWAGLWIVDGGDARYELRCERPIEVELPTETSPRTDTGGVMTAARYLPQLELCSGKHRVRAVLSEVLKCVNLKHGQLSRHYITPISMGVREPIEFIRGAREGERYCRHAGTAMLDGASVDVIEGDRDPSSDGTPIFTWYLDFRRGCIPVKTVYGRDGKVRLTSVVTSIRKCENGGHICERAVTTWTSAVGLHAKIIELVSLDLSKPQRDSLALTLAPGTTVVDTKDMRSFFRLEATEELHVDEIDAWLQRCEAALKAHLAR